MERWGLERQMKVPLAEVMAQRNAAAVVEGARDGLHEAVQTVERGVTEAVQKYEDARRTSEKEVEARTPFMGGPLDARADNISSSITQQTKGAWLSWGRGRD